ncbi:hypothetical protein [Sphingopyxis sp.]|uniref:hypothetical protein n=1 Tax=Sphingopyxis sp. TaxID=1908224 RepID=UPI0026324C19|nr:hypothetical protein [Sphingopyxis sp.]MCW0197702.1 hypothetical protein [Sphingopyxis sp.]
MDDENEAPKISRVRTVLRALGPAVPAVIGAAALTFLFAAVMPMAWVAGISWNLYLDRLSDFFVPPVGNAARLVLAFGMAAVAALIAAFIALLIAEPEQSGLAALGRRMRRNERVDDDADGEAPVRRRRADLHPDDPPRPPIRAGRDLPALGLGPIAAPGESAAATAAPEATPETIDAVTIDAVATDAIGEDELILADLAPVEMDEPGAEPWLQPVDRAGPALPDPADNSLGAMVARFEAGLARRRPESAAAPPIPVPAAPLDADGEGEIDFALEAALSTLQRMNRSTAG